MSLDTSNRAQAMATAARLLAQSAQFTELARRHHDAGIAILAEIAGGADEVSPGISVACRLAAFRAACSERSLRLTGDDHVNEAGAAELLAVARTTLATWRQEGRLDYRKTPGGHIQYALATLAEFVGGYSID